MIDGISNWILSIAGIICLSVIVELIMPEGQLNRYIKGVFSFIVVFVIIMPIPKLLKTDYNFSNIFENSEIQINQDYLYQINLDKISLAQEQIESKIHSRGYQNVKVYINCDIFDNAMEYKSINVDLSSLVISENAEHKDITKIKKDITKIIMDIVDIDEEAILYDG